MVDRPNRPDLDYVYLHADSCGHARVQFTVMEPNRKTSRIVGIAPVVGYFCDDNGDNITVDN